jgi:glutathione S-transferase
MITILGKTTSINVRKVLWTCEEAGLEYHRKITAAVLPQRKRMPSAR